MVVTITPSAYRTAMAARAQQQEGDEQSAGEGGAQLAVASNDAAADDDMNASPSKTKASATLIVAGKKSEEAQASALPQDTAGDDVDMSSSPQPNSAAAAIAAAPESAGAVNTAPQEDAAMEPGEIPSMEERPSATSNVAESKGESGMLSPSLSQYERLDDPQIPVHKLVHYEGEGSSGDDDDDLNDRRDPARSSGKASPLEEKQSVNSWPPSPPRDYSSMGDRRSECSPPYSLASSGGSTRSHYRSDRGGQSRQHDRDDRAEPMVITNVTQRDEDRQLRRNEPELYSWMPSRRDLQLLNGYRSSQYPLALFD